MNIIVNNVESSRMILEKLPPVELKNCQLVSKCWQRAVEEILKPIANEPLRHLYIHTNTTLPISEWVKTPLAITRTGTEVDKKRLQNQTSLNLLIPLIRQRALVPIKDAFNTNKEEILAMHLPEAIPLPRNLRNLVWLEIHMDGPLDPICDLKQLKVLTLYYPQNTPIQWIEDPAQIKNLRSLKQLFINDHTSLTNIAWTTLPPNLHTLWMHKCPKYDKIPPAVFELQYLQRFLCDVPTSEIFLNLHKFCALPRVKKTSYLFHGENHQDFVRRVEANLLSQLEGLVFGNRPYHHGLRTPQKLEELRKNVEHAITYNLLIQTGATHKLREALRSPELEFTIQVIKEQLQGVSSTPETKAFLNDLDCHKIPPYLNLTSTTKRVIINNLVEQIKPRLDQINELQKGLKDGDITVSNSETLLKIIDVIQKEWSHLLEPDVEPSIKRRKISN